MSIASRREDEVGELRRRGRAINMLHGLESADVPLSRPLSIGVELEAGGAYRGKGHKLRDHRK